MADAANVTIKLTLGTVRRGVSEEIKKLDGEILSANPGVNWVQAIYDYFTVEVDPLVYEIRRKGGSRHPRHDMTEMVGNFILANYGRFGNGWVYEADILPKKGVKLAKKGVAHPPPEHGVDIEEELDDWPDPTPIIIHLCSLAT